jgi:hypothetical protein
MTIVIHMGTTRFQFIGVVMTSSMSIDQLNMWGAYFTAKDASEKKHGFISTWEVPSRHPWNVSEKAEFEKAQSEKAGA